jgi:hypothetical protein
VFRLKINHVQEEMDTCVQFLGPLAVVANSLFLTGANTRQETSKKKESRKKDGSNKKHRKGNNRQEEKSLSI